jgi:hypothetical protein
MTGRYGHRGGRGGRGGRSTPNTSTKETKKKKFIEDYFFYVGSSKQASDFETTPNFSSIMSRRHLTEETTWQKHYARSLRRILKFGNLRCSLVLQQKTLKVNKRTVNTNLSTRQTVEIQYLAPLSFCYSSTVAQVNVKGSTRNVSLVTFSLRFNW